MDEPDPSTPRSADERTQQWPPNQAEALLQDSASVLPNGTRLGEFELLSLIGEGGFGIVYLAEDHSLARRVALKEYMPSALAARTADLSVQVKSERYRETFAAGLVTFINEARLLASFDHPALAKVYRFWEANGTAYLVMPYYQGRTLRDALRDPRTTVDEPWLLGLLGPLTEALLVLHAEQCYHRDIAPDNVMMLASTEKPLLMDFGAARRVIGDITQALTVILKPGYAPVEQYAEIPGIKQGPWTDVYALAAVVHYAITGKTPPPSVGRLLNDTYVPLAEAAAGRFSAGFLAAIDRALAVRPERRTQTVAELRRALGLPEPASVQQAVSAGKLLPDDFDPFAAPAVLPPAQAVGQAQPATPADPFADVLAVTDDSRTLLKPSPGRRLPDAFAGSRPPSSDHTQFIAPARSSGSRAGFEARLVVTASTDLRAVGRSVVHRDQRLEIGRECEGLQIADPECSRRHAAIDLTAEGYRVIDLESLNATYVNGRRLAPGVAAPLLFGSTIRIGSTLLTFAQSSELQADLSGGELAGRYRLHERLRTSPKGAIYRATIKDSDIPVALKILAQQASSVQDYRAMFEAEAKIAKQLRHPHICELRDYGHGTLVAGGSRIEVSYLCYSLLAGGNLDDRLVAGRLPTADEALQWIAHVADALDHAHAQGVVHGNVKPTAICYSDAGHVYVTDFAIAEQGAGVLLGAPAYMAPEQWAGAESTARTDQYSLAALGYVLLTGTRPFEGQEDPRIRERNFRRGPEPAHLEAERSGKPRLPPAVSGVLGRALSVEPAARYDSVGEFARRLREAMNQVAVAANATEVFISYQREKSSAWALMIQKELRDRHQIRAFVDSRRFDGAVQFPEKIERAVRECSVFVCLLASNTLQSTWVRREIGAAYEARRPMIPVFQESFKRQAAVPDDPAVHALLQYDGLELLDRRNIHIQHTMNDLVHQIQLTLEGRKPG